MNHRVSLAVVVLAWSLSAALAQSTAPAKVRYPHAGVAVAVPEGFTAQRPEETYDVLALDRHDARGQVELALTLAALPVAPQATLESFAQGVSQQRALAVRNLQAEPAEETTVAGRPARRQRFGYSFRGEPRLAERIVLLAEVEGEPAYRMGYLLTAEGHPAAEAELSAALDALAGSLELFAPEHPGAAPLAADPVAVGELGFSLRLPAEWKIERAGRSFRAYQVDYRLGGQPYPVLTVTVLAAGEPALTAQERSAQAVAGAQALLADQGFEVLAEGPATLGGQEAYRVVSRLAPESGPLACAQYWAVRTGQAYSVSLCGPILDGEHPTARLEPMAASLVETFTFTDAPATAPAP